MAEENSQKGIEQSLGYVTIYVVLALAKFMRAEYDEAIKTYDKLETISPVGESLAALGKADIALHDGRIKDAIEILKNRLASDIKERRTEYLGNKWTLLSYAHLQRRERNLALEVANHAVNASRDFCKIFCASYIYIEAGKEEKAQPIAQELANKLGSKPHAYAKITDGEILKKKGRTFDAIELFNQAQGILDTWLGRFSL